MAALFLGRRILSLRNNLFKNPCRQDSGFYVLLPEIGEDLPEKNPLLKEETLLPEFNQASVEKCIAVIGKQSLEFEQRIRAIQSDIDELPKVDVFKDVFEPIEKLDVPLQTTWGISKILYFGNQSLMPTKCYFSIHKRAWAAIVHKYNTKTIYEACKKAQEELTDLTEEQSRILEKYILEGKLNGLDLGEADKYYFQDCLNRIAQKSEEFKQKVEIATNVFKHKITDPDKMKGFPEEFLKLTAVDPSQYEVGPWIITLKPNVLQTFMEYCPDKLLRWNLWQASVVRCSRQSEVQELETSSLVNGITTDRCEMATYVGFKNFAEMCMTTKMAGSLDNVYDFLETLRQSAYPCQVEELDSLAEFAAERGFDQKLEHWDISYWARKQKRALYNYDEEVLKKYFPLPLVMDGLFRLIKELFNVEIVEHHDDVEVWHRDVDFFDVYDLDVSKTEPCGSFYFDPYVRDQSKVSYNRHSGWVLSIRNKSEIVGCKPLTSIIFNFPTPTADGKPSMLTLKGVQSLFENFGHMLQQVLTRVKSSEVAGLSNVEWDATATSKHLMAMLLYQPRVLKLISRHVDTGESLDDDMIQKLREARYHMAGYNLCKELYLCKFDLDLHSIKRPWEHIMKRAWKEFFVFPEDKRDSHVCSWDSIFVDNLGGAYYTDLWSKMLAADVYSAFQEAKGVDEEQRKIARRYKDTILTMGGSVAAGELFRRFRGRDPCVKAFIESLNLKPVDETT
ncbi:probable cytosolic oligopeptidase A [Copidosoma floridanum]|uniref:probable cytosolic oligopeptidase A n=1 Tax=Copidosoma floridanum TaxID=29053 RepID=UPI0006C99097|nr:probable cytosolic oligopeptidase A [Copidosoma floridanum]